MGGNLSPYPTTRTTVTFPGASPSTRIPCTTHPAHRSRGTYRTTPPLRPGTPGTPSPQRTPTPPAQGHPHTTTVDPHTTTGDTDTFQHKPPPAKHTNPHHGHPPATTTADHRLHHTRYAHATTNHRRRPPVTPHHHRQPPAPTAPQTTPPLRHPHTTRTRNHHRQPTGYTTHHRPHATTHHRHENRHQTRQLLGPPTPQEPSSRITFTFGSCFTPRARSDRVSCTSPSADTFIGFSPTPQPTGSCCTYARHLPPGASTGVATCARRPTPQGTSAGPGNTFQVHTSRGHLHGDQAPTARPSHLSLRQPPSATPPPPRGCPSGLRAVRRTARVA